MHSDETDATLSQHMFGMTNAPYNKSGDLSFLPENPHVSQTITSEIAYYRTDPLYASGDLREIIKEYEDDPDFTKYDYIPIALSKSLSIDAIIDDYASQFKDRIVVVKHKTEPENPMAFIRIPKNESRFFLIKKALTILGLYSNNFISRVAGLGIKSSHWQIAQQEQGATGQAAGALDKLQLPNTVQELKKSPMMLKLITLSKDSKSPTHYLAATLLNLINRLPEDKQVNPEAIKRMAMYLDLGTTLYKKNYNKFAFIVYSIIHELTLLLIKKEITVDYAVLRETAKRRTANMLNLSENDEKLRYIAFPANSGTNALMLALQIAKRANKFGKEVTSISTEGPIYFEFLNLHLQKVTTETAQHDVFLITSGPTVWKGIYPGSDLNKFIRSRLGPDNQLDKPMTLVIDSTSGMHRNLKLDDDLKALVEQGQISIIINESHQKFGLAHSDQAQYGYVFGVCHTDMYNVADIAKYEQEAELDLQTNVDMQIGSYITLCAEQPLEKIKERHFENGRLLRDFFVSSGLSKEHVVLDSISLDDPDRGLFVYVNAWTNVAKVIKKHFEHRGSFGHFNTTWTSCGPFVRISMSASDEVDVYIEASEIYFASFYSRAQLSSNLSSFVQETLLQAQEPSISDQIYFIGMLQTLMHMNYKPKTLVEQFEWSFAIKYMRERCPELSGRKSYQALLESQERRFKQQNSSCPKFLDDIFLRLFKKGVQFEKADELMKLVKEYEAAGKSKKERKNMLALQAAMILLSRGQEANKTDLLSNVTLSKAIIALEECKAFSTGVYSFLKRKDVSDDYFQAIALIKPGPIVPKVLEHLINSKDPNYVQYIAIYYKIDNLQCVVNQRINGFKASDLEKEKLQELNATINQVKSLLEQDLTAGTTPNFSEQKYQIQSASLENYVTFAESSKSNIIKRIAIIVSNLFAQICNFSTQAGPTRTEVKDTAVNTFNDFKKKAGEAVKTAPSENSLTTSNK